jgi:hypothetical protein
MGVVHRDPLESIAVPEPLDKALQFLRGFRRNQGDDGFLEAFGQNDGPPLQLGRQADPFLPDLVEGERDGHKGDHENEGDDEAYRNFHGCSPARFYGPLIVTPISLTSGIPFSHLLFI